MSIATNVKKKTYFAVLKVGGTYEELKVKEFCVFEHLELLFLNGLFQNNYMCTCVFEVSVHR